MTDESLRLGHGFDVSGARVPRMRRGAPGDGNDAFGTALALVVGVLVAVLLAMPALPAGAGVRLGGLVLDPVETALVVAALSILLVPLGTFALYQVFALSDR